MSKLKQYRKKHRSPDDPKEYCCYCGVWLVFPYVATLEHLIPKSKNGRGGGLNIRLCCSTCNVWRSNKNLTSWKREVRELLQAKKKKKCE